VLTCRSSLIKEGDMMGRETIFRVSGTILEDTAQEVDPVEVDGNGFLKM
jgi:hypothetical protein